MSTATARALPAGPLAERLNQIASEAGLILVLDLRELL